MSPAICVGRNRHSIVHQSHALPLVHRLAVQFTKAALMRLLRLGDLASVGANGVACIRG